MGLFDIAAKAAAVKVGPTGWQQRVAEEIVFKSPEGNEYHAYWRGSPRSMPKKLGVFKIPKVKGDIVQDMEVSSSIYPIQFYFAGANNDKLASAFFEACKEKGLWEITHPIHGLLGLQLVSVEEVDDPIESGNITEFKTEWIEPIDPLTLKTVREMRGVIDAKVVDLNSAAADQFEANAAGNSLDMIGAISATAEAIVNLSNRILDPLFGPVDALYAAEYAISDGIRDVYNATVLRARNLVGLIQQLIELPVASNSMLEDRLSKFTDLADEVMALMPGGSNPTVRTTATDEEKRNAISVIEAALMACLAAAAGVISTTSVTPAGLTPDEVGGLRSRSQAVKAVLDLADFHDSIITALEDAQTAFNTKPIDKQYFSALTTYTQAALLVGMCIERLLKAALDLSVERRFTLDRPRAPIEITVTEYGQLGEDDAYFDLFIRSNDLHGKDILLLPRGREVLVYG
jgi:hypothetical protein